MDAMEAILSRRSIRKYSGEGVGEEDVKAMLEAAMAAPSAANQQPWRFVVIDDRELLDAVPEFHQYARMLKEAPLAILVCTDTALQSENVAVMWVQDCSAATENLLLAAHALGLGAVWLGIYPGEERVQGMRELLGLPEEVTPFALVSIGHPAEEKPPAGRYDGSRVHRNAMGG